jgi:hypothetical protein
MADTSSHQELPNGPVAAAVLAGGMGTAALGLMTVLVEMSAWMRTALTWSAPVGPLSGKTGTAVIFFFVSWAIAHKRLVGKDVNLSRVAAVALTLLAFGLLATFPPFFLLFAAE